MQTIHPEKKILITGSTGLLGSHLIQHLLEQGYRSIRALRQPLSDLSLLPEAAAGQVEWVEADVLDLPALEEAMQGVERVFHCAGIISFDRRDAALMRQVNVEGTANVVNLCLDYGVEKLVHVSSVAAIGRSKPGQTISEASKWERSPYNTRYGISKFLAEQEVWRGIEEGLNAVVINPSIILGPGRWDQGPARFFPMLYNGFPMYPQGATALVDVRDVARMMQLLMESDIHAERFIATAGHLPYKAFFAEIAAALGRQAPKVGISPILQQAALRWTQLKSLWSQERSLITPETLRQASAEFFYDNTKSIQRLGFTYTPIKQTIAEAAQAFLYTQGR